MGASINLSTAIATDREATGPATPAPEQIVARSVPRLMWLGTANFLTFCAVGGLVGRPFSIAFVGVGLGLLAAVSVLATALTRRGQGGAAVHVMSATVLVALLGIEFGGSNTVIIPAAYGIPVLSGIACGRPRAAGMFAVASTGAYVVAVVHQAGGSGSGFTGAEVWQVATAVLSAAFLLGAAALAFGLYRSSVRTAYAALERRHADALHLADRLANATQDMLDMLVQTLDARESETAQHSQRVSRLSVAIAEALDLEGDELEVIRRGALLHDIGKISVPDAVLLKPAALNAGEWALMRGHADAGYRLLSGVPALAAEAELVRAHHERWDGRGYPSGRQGEAIPLGARIFAIADTFDAITSARPYRPARTPAEAMAIIAAQSGSQFDPAVVIAFLGVCQPASAAA